MIKKGKKKNTSLRSTICVTIPPQRLESLTKKKMKTSYMDILERIQRGHFLHPEMSQKWSKGWKREKRGKKHKQRGDHPQMNDHFPQYSFTILDRAVSLPPTLSFASCSSSPPPSVLSSFSLTSSPHVSSSLALSLSAWPQISSPSLFLHSLSFLLRLPCLALLPSSTFSCLFFYHIAVQ